MKGLFPMLYFVTIHNSPVFSVNLYIVMQRDKENVIYIHNGILIIKNDGNMNGTGSYCVKSYYSHRTDVTCSHVHGGYKQEFPKRPMQVLNGQQELARKGAREGPRSKVGQPVLNHIRNAVPRDLTSIRTTYSSMLQRSLQRWNYPMDS